MLQSVYYPAASHYYYYPFLYSSYHNSVAHPKSCINPSLRTISQLQPSNPCVPFWVPTFKKKKKRVGWDCPHKTWDPSSLSHPQRRTESRSSWTGDLPTVYTSKKEVQHLFGHNFSISLFFSFLGERERERGCNLQWRN